MIPERLQPQSQPKAPAPAAQGEPRERGVQVAKHFAESLYASLSRSTRTVDPATIAEAPRWRPGSEVMSGAKANRVITDYYSNVDDWMAQYLGEPTVANWATFAKYASREAGQQIHELEALLELAHDRSPGDLLALTGEFLSNPRAIAGQAKLLWDRSGSPRAFLDKVQHLRDALVHGNTGIIKDIVPAFTTFLDAERAGKSGLRAMEAQGFGRAPRDPNGHILEAFRHFRVARELDDQLKQLPDRHGPEAEKLLARRVKHVAAANLRLGMQEQWVTLQQPKTFGDPVVADLVAALTPSMALTDATGTHELLPNGGNWANFADRMGLLEVKLSELPPEKRDKVYTLADASGEKHHFILNPDLNAREGSIYDYFTSDLGPERARALRQAAPRPYDKSYRVGGGLEGLWEGAKALVARLI